MSSPASPSLRNHIESALAFLPFHRARAGQRQQSLHLDQLLDEARSLGSLSHSSLDFVFMTYRYWHAFREEKHKFQPKEIRPAPMQDLWALGFAALLTRDQTPPEVLVNDLVAVAKKLFGAHTGSITNAFLRHIGRQREALRQRLREAPEILLGPSLRQRWGSEVSRQVGKKLLARPAPGIEAFNESADFLRLPREDFFQRLASEKLQSINAGSWELVQWISRDLEAPPASPLKILDACAAPGGKTLALRTQLRKRNIATETLACDAKFARLQLLQDNLRRWNVAGSIATELCDWTLAASEIPLAVKNFKPDLVVADLPCSGLGTVASRPDLLLENFEEKMPAVMRLQREILQKLLELYPRQSTTFFVSICSTDPYEIENISHSLNQKPGFHSFRDDSDAEGLVGWRLDP